MYRLIIWGFSPKIYWLLTITIVGRAWIMKLKWNFNYFILPPPQIEKAKNLFNLGKKCKIREKSDIYIVCKIQKTGMKKNLKCGCSKKVITKGLNSLRRRFKNKIRGREVFFCKTELKIEQISWWYLELILLNVYSATYEMKKQPMRWKSKNSRDCSAFQWVVSKVASIEMKAKTKNITASATTAAAAAAAEYHPKNGYRE